MNRRHFLASAGGGAVIAGAAPSTLLAQPASRPADDWTIGPVIRGRNYSVGMPLRPDPAPGAEWSFDFPGPRVSDGHVHYVTRDTGPLTGARGISMRYRIDARPGTRFVPQEHPDLPGAISLYVQEYGDDWRARRGRSEFSRWYSPHARVQELSPGEHDLTIMFDEAWISVLGGSNPAQLQDTLRRAETIGMTFGSRQARGHGVFATQPARFTLLDYAVI